MTRSISGRRVESGGREVGRVERVVLDRGTFEATHLVVRHGADRGTARARANQLGERGVA